MQNKFDFLSEGAEKIYFSGILGSSLSSLARLTAKRGYTVAGSDSGESTETARRLTESGITVYSHQTAENPSGFDALVYSSAVPDTCPELVYARKTGMKIFTRAEFLGHIIKEYRHRIGVSGTHGKSTASGMLAEAFSAGKRDITALIGADGENFPGGLRTGNGDTVIYEACEYKRSFLSLSPSLAVVLNVEREHTDCYPELSDAVTAYAEFAESASVAVLNYDDYGCQTLGKCLKNPKKAWFSVTNPNAELYAENICCADGFYSFNVCIKGEEPFSVCLRVPGIHNVQNALAAAGAAYFSGVSAEKIREGLMRFSGMRRRLEYIGECRGAAVYDDYAHHPTEIRSSLDCVRKFGFKKVICAFQPHTYSRTAAFFNEFAEALGKADEAVITDIFAARESDSLGMSGRRLAEAVKNGVYISDFGEITEYLYGKACPETLIITMGAGRLNTVAKELTAKN